MTLFCRKNSAFATWALATLISGALVGCGGGGGSNPTPSSPPPAPSALSYPGAPALTRGTAMPTLSPTVTGSVTTYSVNPPLPAGIALNTSSGIISGTPTAISAAANYQVTATNASGSTNTTVALTVNDVAPDISYPQSQYNWSTGSTLSLTPASTGGAVVTWTISPALPAGVALDAATGVISGSPDTATAVSVYTVTATNSGGADTFALTLNVENGVLLELGHTEDIVAVAYDGQRALSTDSSGRAVLWDGQTREIITTRSGVRHTASQVCWTSCYSLIALADDTAVVETPTSLIVLDASDGSELAIIPFLVTASPAVNLRWWTLATDGSYIATASDTELNIWSRTGALLATKTNDYLPSKPFAAPGELRLGNTAAAANVIERIAVPSGASTLSATHQGTFHSWFTDGSKFLSNVGNTVWVYSNALTQLDLAGLDSIQDLTGQGNWFWTRNTNSLRVYSVGNSAAPAVTYPLSNSNSTVAKGAYLTVLQPDATQDVSVINLAGAVPSRTDHSTIQRSVSAIAVNSDSDWIVGQGSILAGDATGPAIQIYSFGLVRSIAADARHIAVATSAERLLVFDATTRALVMELPFPAEKVQLADSGNQLVALNVRIPPSCCGGYAGNTLWVRSYSLTTGNILQQWQYMPGSGVTPMDFSVARASTTIGQSLYEGAAAFGEPQPYERLVSTLANGPLWSAEIHGGFKIFLSPDGGTTAIPVEPTSSSPFPGSPPTTNLYANGVLSGALPGRFAGWLDDSRAVINRMRGGLSFGSYVLDRVDVVSTTGNVLATLPIAEEVGDIEPVTANSFYAASLNQILDATTGAVLFSSSAPPRSPGVGAVAGPNVVFTSGTSVRIEPR